jgi:hypothetical protein
MKLDNAEQCSSRGINPAFGDYRSPDVILRLYALRITTMVPLAEDKSKRLDKSRLEACTLTTYLLLYRPM